MHTIKIKHISAAMLSLAVLAGSTTATFAQSASPTAGSVGTIIAKGDADVAARITSLNTLQTTLSGLKHLPDADKAAFAGQIATEISGLNSQKAKLEADTDVTAARADRQAIFTQFRIYMLFIPKTHILAAADSMNDVAGSMQTVAAKLQTRISQDQAQGKDVSALISAMTDLQNKLVDAKSQYQNAENAVNPLVPDQGNQSVIASNQAALQNARGMIKTGAQDLKTGRSDIQTIWTGLKALH